MALLDVGGVGLFCAKLPGLVVLQTLLQEGVSICYIVTTHGDYEKKILVLAKDSGIPCFCDLNLKNKENADYLASLKAMFGFCVSYPNKIPLSLLQSFAGHGFNFHPARLPDYRGCFPTVWPILEGEASADYTIMIMDENFDTGPIVDFERVHIDELETGWSLYSKLVRRLPTLVRRNLLNIFENKVVQKPQNEETSRYFSNQLPNNGQFEWSWPTLRVERFVRALYHPSLPCAKAYLNDVLVEFENARPIESYNSEAKAGQFTIENRGLIVSCSDGGILAECVRFDGQRFSMIGIKKIPGELRFLLGWSISTDG